MAITVRAKGVGASPDPASGAGIVSNIGARGEARSPPSLAALLAVPLVGENPHPVASPRRAVQARIVTNAESGSVELQWTYQ